MTTLANAKRDLSKLLDQIERTGEPVIITRRGKAVAKLVPVLENVEDDEARLARLERAGIIKRGAGPLDLSSLPGDLPRLEEGESLLEALLEERREGR